MPDIYGSKSTTGRYAKGNNVYNGTASSPNPRGNNQSSNTALQNAAALKRKRRAAMGYIQEPTIKNNSLLTNKGGLFT
jgi:hypothetical protein